LFDGYTNKYNSLNANVLNNFVILIASIWNLVSMININVCDFKYFFPGKILGAKEEK